MNEGQKHNGGQTFWCIVMYIGASPFYYCGYYDRYSGEGLEGLKPAMSIDFNEALKMHSKKEAERLLAMMNRPQYKVEEHAYM